MTTASASFWLQRLSAVTFLVALVVHNHFIGPTSTPLAFKATALTLLLSGIVHIVTSVAPLLSELRPLARVSAWMTPALAAAGLLGALAGGRAIIETRGRPRTPGHLPASRCSMCHEAPHQRWPFDLHAAPGGPNLPCERCHDVLSTAPALVSITPAEGRSRPEAEPCAGCHRERLDRTSVFAGNIHDKLACRDCHGVPSGGLSAAASCKTCHPLAGDTHADVTTLDTTLVARNSPHDVHALTCRSCHAARVAPWRTP